jgi:hypothetical protein
VVGIQANPGTVEGRDESSAAPLPASPIAVLGDVIVRKNKVWCKVVLLAVSHVAILLCSKALHCAELLDGKAVRQLTSGIAISVVVLGCRNEARRYLSA